jgi:hypothetical protein
MDGWMDGWVGVKAVLRIAYSNQKMEKERRRNDLVTKERRKNYRKVGVCVCVCVCEREKESVCLCVSKYV